MPRSYTGEYETRAEPTDTGFVRHRFVVGANGIDFAVDGVLGYYWMFCDEVPVNPHGPFASAKEAYDDAMNQ